MIQKEFQQYVDTIGCNQQLIRSKQTIQTLVTQQSILFTNQLVRQNKNDISLSNTKYKTQKSLQQKKRYGILSHQIQQLKNHLKTQIKHKVASLHQLYKQGNQKSTDLIMLIMKELSQFNQKLELENKNLRNQLAILLQQNNEYNKTVKKCWNDSKGYVEEIQNIKKELNSYKKQNQNIKMQHKLRQMLLKQTTQIKEELRKIRQIDTDEKVGQFQQQNHNNISQFDSDYNRIWEVVQTTSQKSQISELNGFQRTLIKCQERLTENLMNLKQYNDGHLIKLQHVNNNHKSNISTACSPRATSSIFISSTSSLQTIREVTQYDDFSFQQQSSKNQFQVDMGEQQKFYQNNESFNYDSQSKEKSLINDLQENSEFYQESTIVKKLLKRKSLKNQKQQNKAQKNIFLKNNNSVKCHLEQVVKKQSLSIERLPQLTCQNGQQNKISQSSFSSSLSSSRKINSFNASYSGLQQQNSKCWHEKYQQQDDSAIYEQNLNENLKDALNVLRSYNKYEPYDDEKTLQNSKQNSCIYQQQHKNKPFKDAVINPNKNKQNKSIIITNFKHQNRIQVMSTKIKHHIKQQNIPLQNNKLTSCLIRNKQNSSPTMTPSQYDISINTPRIILGNININPQTKNTSPTIKITNHHNPINISIMNKTYYKNGQ